MGKRTIFALLTLTLIWMVLSEGFSWQNAAVGMFVSMVCMHFIGKFFRHADVFEEIGEVNFFKIVWYPLWLVKRIYRDALFVVMMIVRGDALWGITKEDLHLKNESLRLMLAASITLTPGSVFVDLDEKSITLLCLGKPGEKGFPAVMRGVRDIEGNLVKAERDPAASAPPSEEDA